MKDRIRSGAGFQRSLRFLNSDEQGMDSLELRLAVARRILPALNRICARRFLRISFTSPGQVFVSPDGAVRLIVKDQSQVYQLKNLLPTLHREVEKACGFPVPEITVGVNPGLHESLSSRAETATGDPRKANPDAAAAIREKARGLPEGSVTRKSLESLAESLEK